MSMTPEERTEQTITEYGYRFYSDELRDLLIRQFRAAENDALERAARLHDAEVQHLDAMNPVRALVNAVPWHERMATYIRALKRPVTA